jgi:hypothetical protein
MDSKSRRHDSKLTLEHNVIANERSDGFRG